MNPNKKESPSTGQTSVGVAEPREISGQHRHPSALGPAPAYAAPELVNALRRRSCAAGEAYKYQLVRVQRLAHRCQQGEPSKEGSSRACRRATLGFIQ